MRTHVTRAVYDDTIMNGLAVTRDKIFAGDADSVGLRPYLVFRWGDTTPGMDVSRFRSLVVWVHDQPNDYSRIDKIISRLRDILTGMKAERTDTGWITEIEWVTDSGDLSDDISRTILRTSTYTIVGSGQ
jgi:hypothetical protein